MHDELLAVCVDSLRTKGVGIETNTNGQTFVTLKNGNKYQISVADYEFEVDEELDLPFIAHSPKVIDDHFAILEQCIFALTGSKYQISNLSQDGDHKDCEAIFKVDGEYYVLKVR